MINYLYNWFVYALTGFQLLFKLFVQKKFMKQLLAADLNHFSALHDDSLDEKDFIKIRKYYGLAVPGVLGEAFALLRGKKMTIAERSALTYLGGVTGLFDDFFDKTHTPKEHVRSLIADTQGVKTNNSIEALFMTLYHKALMHSNQAALIKTRSLEVYDAQVASKSQASPAISHDAIRDITFRKGGISLIFYRIAMDHHLGAAEMEMLNTMGSLFQLENDIFDIYKDYRKGIKTLATTATDMQPLHNEYLVLIKSFVQSVEALPYAKKNKKRFIRRILVVISRGLVALRQLRKKQKQSQQLFTIDQYTRKDLVCDMEKPINIFRTTHYFARINPK